MKPDRSKKNSGRGKSGARRGGRDGGGASESSTDAAAGVGLIESGDRAAGAFVVARPGAVWGWLAAVAGGILGGLAFAPVGLAPLIVFAPAGLFLGMENSATPRRALGRSLVGALAFYLIAISWLMSLRRFNYFAPVGVSFLALYMALYPAVAAWAVKRFCARAPLMGRFAAFSALWLWGEIFRTLGRLAMPFSQLGHAWANLPWAIQWADLFGEAAVSAQVLIGAAAVVALARKLARGRVAEAWFGPPAEAGAMDSGAPNAAAGARRGWAAPAGLAGALGLALAGSAARARAWEARVAAAPEDRKIKIAIVQPNIPQEYKLATNLSPDANERREVREAIMTVHEKLAREVPVGADLIVMPEATFPGLEFNFDKPLQERIKKMVAGKGAGLLFGADRAAYLEDKLKDGPEEFNTAWFLPYGADFDQAGYQDKMRLVPFGEHLPYFELIPYFNETFVGIGSFTEGREVHIFDCAGRGFGTQICFESTFGAQSRKIALAGAEFLTIITNDAWYGDSAGAAQHHALSCLRAVETRRPVVRGANTGISSLINAAGRAESSLPLGRRGVLVGEIAPMTGTTFYARWGNLWLTLACWGCFFGVAVRSRRAA